MCFAYGYSWNTIITYHSLCCHISYAWVSMTHCYSWLCIQLIHTPFYNKGLVYISGDSRKAVSAFSKLSHTSHQSGGLWPIPFPKKECMWISELGRCLCFLNSIRTGVFIKGVVSRKKPLSTLAHGGGPWGGELPLYPYALKRHIGMSYFP